MKHWSEEFDEFKQVRSEVELTSKSISFDADRGNNDLTNDLAYYQKTCEKSFTNYVAETTTVLWCVCTL